MREGFPTGSAKMPARVLLGAFVISHPQVPRSQDQILPCFSQNVNGIEDCWRKHNIPTTAVQNMWMLHHGFWMWKNRRASLLPSPPCYWGARLWSFCVASKHIPTIQQVQQQSNLLYGKEWQLPCWKKANGPYPHPFLIGCQSTSIPLASLHWLLHSSPICISYPKASFSISVLSMPSRDPE